MIPIHRITPLVLLLACGNSDHHDITTLLDGPSSDSASLDGPGSDSALPDAPAQAPNTVKLDFVGTPDLIVYRDGTGPWVVPTAVTGGYSLRVTDDYQVVAACSFAALAGNEDSEQLNATFDDGAEQFMFCGAASSGTTFPVTGQMLEPGSVHMEDSATGATSPWSFSLNVSAGTHDLARSARRRC